MNEELPRNERTSSGKDRVQAPGSDMAEELIDDQFPFPAPRAPFRLWRRIIGACILLSLVVIAVFIRMVIFKTSDKAVAKFVSVSGTVEIYEGDNLIRSKVRTSTKIIEGQRVCTGIDSKAVYEAFHDEPGYPVPVTLYLRGNTSVLNIKPPAIELEKGEIVAVVPKGSPGLRVILKEERHPVSAQCLIDDGDAVIIREPDRLIVYVYRGSVSLTGDHGASILEVGEGFFSSVSPGAQSAGPERIAGGKIPEELTGNR